MLHQFRRPTLRTVFETVSTLMMLVAATTVVYVIWMDDGPRRRAPRVEALPKEPISISGAATRGNPAARVALIIFSDFECPYCAKFATQILPEIDRHHVAPGKILLAFRNLPLPNHKFANQAAQAAECAGRQGKFWQMHDALFRDPRHLDDPSLSERAGGLGLELTTFAACLTGPSSEAIKTDMNLAVAAGISGTPAFFVGLRQQNEMVKVTNRISGVKPYDDFDRILTKVTQAASRQN